MLKTAVAVLKCWLSTTVQILVTRLTKACELSSFITEAYNIKETLAVSGQPKGPMKQKRMAVEENPVLTTLK